MELRHIELVIVSFPCHQFRRAALFQDSALVDNKDAVCRCQICHHLIIEITQVHHRTEHVCQTHGIVKGFLVFIHQSVKDFLGLLGMMTSFQFYSILNY